MSAQPKPVRLWGVTYVDAPAEVIPETIRRTRRESIAVVCAETTRGWPYWRDQGCRAVRVTVTVEPTP